MTEPISLQRFYGVDEPTWCSWYNIRVSCSNNLIFKHKRFSEDLKHFEHPCFTDSSYTQQTPYMSSLVRIALNLLLST